MSDKPYNTDAANDGPLFQNTDEQERIYASQQVPDAVRPTEANETAGAASSGEGRERIAGAEGDQATVPIVAVRPDISMNTPVPLPATTEEATSRDDSLR